MTSRFITFAIAAVGIAKYRIPQELPLDKILYYLYHCHEGGDKNVSSN